MTTIDTDNIEIISVSVFISCKYDFSLFLHLYIYESWKSHLFCAKSFYFLVKILDFRPKWSIFCCSKFRLFWPNYDFLARFRLFATSKLVLTYVHVAYFTYSRKYRFKLLEPEVKLTWSFLLKKGQLINWLSFAIF